MFCRIFANISSDSDKANQKTKQKLSNKINNSLPKAKENLITSRGGLSSKDLPSKAQHKFNGARVHTKPNDVNGKNKRVLTKYNSNVDKETSLSLSNGAIVNEKHIQTNGFTTTNNDKYAQDNRPIAQKLKDRKSIR